VKNASGLVERIAAHPFMRDIPAKYIALLAEHAMDVSFSADEVIFRTGDPANRFYLLESGEVELESASEASSVSIQMLGPGEVLGWSWLFPPYEWQFDARAVVPTKAIFLYGSRLREVCESQPELGYALMKATSAVLIERLQATRRELLKRITEAPAAKNFT
jgi:CRP/FNR family cyclic AMP-dependent transcriptional regulator